MKKEDDPKNKKKPELEKSLDLAEGEEETVDESLREHERKERQGGK